MLAASPANATFPGRNGRIAFQHFSSTAPPQIVSLSPSGANARAITDFRGGAVEPDWAPRGGRMVFTRLSASGGLDRLFTIRGGGEGLRRLSRGCTGQCLGDSDAAYSPDGRQIVFSRAYGPIVDDSAARVDVMVMNRKGTRMRVILRSHRSGKRHLEPHGSQWSPDGQTLAFALLDLNSPRFTSAIFTLELESGDLDRITPWRLNAGNPDWSPDGRRIAFNSHFEGQARSSLYTVAPDGTARRRLTNPKARLTYEPSFSPSGHRLVYVVAGRGVTLHLARMTVGGAERGRITRKTLRGVQPDWGPRP